MSGGQHQNSERLQAIMTALLRRKIEESLGDVEGALGRWRQGELGVFEAHAELLRHAAQAERLAERMARVGFDSAAALLRDAFDGGLVDREEFVELVGEQPEQVEPTPPVEIDGERQSPPDKRELVEKLLSDGPILVHIDARRDDLSVPDKFRGDPKLVLRFGYGLTPAIVDLSVDDDGIAGTLTFGGVPHRCVLSWAGVYAVVSEVDQRGMVWPDDVPATVVDHLAADRPDSDGAARAESSRDDDKQARRSHLKVVK